MYIPHFLFFISFSVFRLFSSYCVVCITKNHFLFYLCSFVLCIRFPSARVLHVKAQHRAHCIILSAYIVLPVFLCGKYSNYRRVIFPVLLSRKDIINKLRIRFIQKEHITLHQRFTFKSGIKNHLAST